MKYIYFFLMIIGCHYTALSQTTGGLRGSVKTSDGNPAAFVNVSIQGTSKGATADWQGNYEIKNVPPGNHVVVASFVGLEVKQQTVEVLAGRVTIVDFALSENTTALEEIIVSARPQLNKEEDMVAKTPLKKLENPQTYSSVSTEILKQQAITNYDDAFRNVPGISRTWEATGRDGDGAAFFALRGLESQSGLVNGLPAITNGNLDPANVQEIQVMKGPSATLFGANATAYSSYGGIINVVTKKPYFTKGGEIAYSIGSFGLSRITADVNAPLSQEDRVALRVNAAYHTEGSFQDAGFKKSLFIAPSLAYEVNDRLKFLVNTEILEEERAVAPVFFHSNRYEPLTFKTVDELDLNTNLSFTTNDLSIKNPRASIQAQMIYKISDQWTSQSVVSRGSAKSDGYYTYIWAGDEGDNIFSQSFTDVEQSRTTTNVQQNFNGDFKIGKVRNRVLIGFDYLHQEIDNRGIGYEFVRNVTPQGLVPGEEIYLTRAIVDSVLMDAGSDNNSASFAAFGAYVSDVVNITDQLIVLASLRADYFYTQGDKVTEGDAYDEFVLSPKIGVVYQIVPEKFSVFANYQTAFHNNGVSFVTDDPDGKVGYYYKPFKADHANQWEAGVKANLLRDRLFATASYYNINVFDRLYTDPVRPYNSIQGGEVESKGFEIEVTANLFQGFSLITGYSHNETLNVAGASEDFYSQPGTVPGGQGPQDQFNFWATYRLNFGKLKNLGFGVGGNYASEYRVADGVLTGVFDLPSYKVFNASIFYHPEKFRIGFNLNNVFDEEYYIGYWSVNPQKPRNFVVSFAYKF
ncbi:TonB-dependent receptor [Pseudochryseolinea flava]|uniref:TonB-dependent siderophore receptor n=1 Tax=Pseudochryseolinea flava TaxID=2059302 RepID=A0A364Y4D5_9BACT|nr:TonB-dependent receptor [Pseudochryseolinea flava]RAW00665.1 TonB-dependent siderophore receptor [Pseudochryseolinea flava]